MPRNFDDSYRQDSVDATRGWDGPERRVSRTPNKALVAANRDCHVYSCEFGHYHE